MSGKRASDGKGQASEGADGGALVPALCEVPPDDGKHKRRASRSAALPPAPEDRALDYAASREELRGIEPGEIVLAVEQLEGFRRVVRPALEAADEARLAPRPGEEKRRGQRPRYFALDYWRFEMLRRVIASQSTVGTRDWLTTDKAKRTRELLGFDKPRPHGGGKPQRWMEGVPSDSWVSDFRTKWLPEARLAELMQQLEKWALAEKLRTLPGAREECRVLYADGSKVETHATAPIVKKDKDGNVIEVVNEWKKGRDGELVPGITAPEAGYVPNRGGNADHSGHGWNIVMVMSSKGTVLAHRNVPMHAGESTTLIEMVPEVGQVLRALGGADGDGPERDGPELRVLSTDCNFHSHELRRELREIGIIENTHLSSHARRPSSQKDAKERGGKRYPIDRHPDWFLNGHRELKCACGKGKTSRVASIHPKTGKAAARLKGECPQCKSVTITSGLWMQTENASGKFLQCLPHDRARVEWDVGNPLTFNDPLSKAYGQSRFNGQEGAFGSQFTQRFGLLKNKRWFYRQSQVDLEVAAVVTITHALSLERWRRMGCPVAGDVDAGDGAGGVGADVAVPQALAA
jgi:hypothetical protein